MTSKEFLREKEKTLNSLRLLRPGLKPDDVDPGVYEIVMALNELDFLYTMSSSSGIPRDHDGKYQKGLEYVEKNGYQGWVTVLIDIESPKLRPFKSALEKICNVEFNGIKGLSDVKILQAFVPDAYLHDPMYLANVWKEVYDVVKSFK